MSETNRRVVLAKRPSGLVDGETLLIESGPTPAPIAKLKGAKKVVGIAGWIAEGKIKPSEHTVERLEKAPDALNPLFSGGNTGKVIVAL